MRYNTGSGCEGNEGVRLCGLEKGGDLVVAAREGQLEGGVAILVLQRSHEVSAETRWAHNLGRGVP